MADAEERIRQKVKSATEIHDYTVIFFDKIRHAEDEGKARKEWLEVCDKKEWINVKEVLQIHKELFDDFPCKPCMDIDTSLSPCQLDLVKWYTKWKIEGKLKELEK